MRTVLFITLVLSLFDDISSQFITVGSTNIRNKASKSSCDNAGKSILVEHFFNIIFNEFHNTPPVCVCVQMCPDQPTYCYPNGCLKREGNKKPVIPVTKANEKAKSILFAEEKSDFIKDFVNTHYVDENKAAFVPVPFKQSNVIPINLRPDPFKDRYKILFKYKKMPKVEFKYNLGEQVKNTMSDALKKDNTDVAKSRWPRNKMYNHFNGHRIQIDALSNPDARFFISNDNDIPNYPPKYFKRELTNDTNKDNEDLDMKAIYVVGKSDLDNTPFSLEKLIDSLIENSFESNKTSNFTNETDMSARNNASTVTTKPFTSRIETVMPANNIIEMTRSNEISPNSTTDIVSMNLTNENHDKNKYNKSTKVNVENKRYEVNDMIASLAKKIEIQNNTSLEMMRLMTDEFSPETTTNTDKYMETTNEKENITIVTTETSISNDVDIKTTKKSRQRLARRLLNSKNN